MIRNSLLASQVAKPVLVGLTGAITVSLVETLSGTVTPPVELLGAKIPFWFLAGASSGAASFIAEGAHNYILPHIPHNERYAKLESIILEPIVAGAAVLGAIAIADGGFKRSALPLMALGGFSVAAGGFIYTGLTAKPKKTVRHH